MVSQYAFKKQDLSTEKSAFPLHYGLLDKMATWKGKKDNMILHNFPW